MLRVLLAFILTMPLYMVIDFGWEYILILGVQVLAGIDIKLSELK